MAQWVKDPALSLQWLRWSLLWLRFGPWPRNFHMLWVWPKQTNKTKKGEKVLLFCGGRRRHVEQVHGMSPTSNAAPCSQGAACRVSRLWAMEG